ncbi:MAG: hypothetical protein PVH12_03490 [Candidatus Bathyarchaeota archaeon]|jgi:hypothetical protein
MGFIRLALVVSVLGVVQFFLLTFLAAFFYPGGFNYLGYFFSDLGAVMAKNGEPNLISSTLFPIAVGTVAITLVPFWLIVRLQFVKSTSKKILSILGSVLGLTASPFLIGVAIFPMDTQLETHVLMTLIFFSFFVLATLLYSIVSILNRDHPNYSGVLGLALFIVSMVILVDPLAPYVAILQTFVLYGYFAWVLLQTFLVWRWKEL